MSRYVQHVSGVATGVEVLPYLPAGWQLMRLKYVAERLTVGIVVNPSTFVSDEGLPFIYGGDITEGRISFETARRISVQSSELHIKTSLRAGDLLTVRVGAPGVTAVVPLECEGGNCASVMHIRRGTAHSTWLCYALNSRFVRSQVEVVQYGAAQEQFNISHATEFLIPVPPSNEQAVIADRLDRATIRLDTLIEKKTRFIELLREKRQALITQAVTLGFNPNVRMKDSGVEWLGQVPAHWTAVPAKYLCSLLKDGTHLPPARVDSGVALLSVRNVVNGAFVRRDDDSLISSGNFDELCRSFRPRAGDVLLAIVGATLGKCAVVPADFGDFQIQRSLALFRGRENLVQSAWLRFVLLSTGFQSLLWEHAGYSAQPGIYLGTLGDFRLPLPPISEQDAICQKLDAATERIDRLIYRTEASVNLLRERRAALITAAVTGQIDLSTTA